MSLPAGLLEKIARSQASGGGTVIKDGVYRLMILKMMVDKKFKGTCFIVEFEVVESKPAIEGVTPNAPGSRCSYVVNLDRNVSAAGNCKAIILALLGVDESKLTHEGKPATDEQKVAQIMECVAWCVGEQNPTRGMLIDDTTFRKEIQSGANAGKPFTGHIWARVEQTPAEIASRRQAIDAKQKAA